MGRNNSKRNTSVRKTVAQVWQADEALAELYSVLRWVMIAWLGSGPTRLTRPGATKAHRLPGLARH